MKKILFSLSLILMMACGNTTQKNEVHQPENHAENHTEHHQEHTQEASLEDCANCGMPTAEFPKWKTVLTQDDKTQNFCAPRCMFMTYLKDSAGLQKASIQVNEYYEQELIDAKSAFYVIKSDVTGPMGHDLVPFKDRASAEEFLADHKGEKVLDFEGVTMQVIQDLVGQ